MSKLFGFDVVIDGLNEVIGIVDKSPSLKESTTHKIVDLCE